MIAGIWLRNQNWMNESMLIMEKQKSDLFLIVCKSNDMQISVNLFKSQFNNGERFLSDLNVNLILWRLTDKLGR